MYRGGKQVTLGYFATAEEAALCIARTPEGRAAAAAAAAVPPPMTAEEAVRQAEAEGLTLLKADNSTGYKNVGLGGGKSKSKPYQAQVTRGGKYVFLGRFTTAEEGALAFARAAAAPAASSRKRKVEPEEEHPNAEEDDVEDVVLTGEIVEDSGEDYVEVEAYVCGEDDNDEAVYAEACFI